MEQPVAKEMNVLEIARIFRKWKWLLLFAGISLLAAGGAFVLLNAGNNFELGIMIPKQINFSFDEKENFNLSVRSLSKNEYEKIAVFLMNRDWFRQYVRTLPSRRMPAAAEPSALRSVIIPKYAVDFSNGSVRNETLQYLLFKAKPDSGLSVDLVGNFTLNIFKNYYLLEIFRAYHNYLQTMSIKLLDNQRLMADSMEKLSIKIAQLHEQKKEYPGSLSGRGNFMLQVTGDTERYLDLAQQLAANDILLSDTASELEMNRKKSLRTQFLIQFLNDLRREFLETYSGDPDQARRKLREMQSGFTKKELSPEFQKLTVFFDLVDYNFKFYRGDPLMLKDRFVPLKALAVFIFVFGLLFLATLMLERRRMIRL